MGRAQGAGGSKFGVWGTMEVPDRIGQLLRRTTGHGYASSMDVKHEERPGLSVEAARQEIEAEHHMLTERLSALVRLCPVHSTVSGCSGCVHGNPETCLLSLQDVVGDLLGYMVSHFHHEEALMRRWGLQERAREQCNRHKEAHGDISEAFARLAGSLNGSNPLPRVLEVHGLVQSWLGRHMVEHDGPLLSMIAESGRQ